jgi:hypothetical protein
MATHVVLLLQVIRQRGGHDLPPRAAAQAAKVSCARECHSGPGSVRPPHELVRAAGQDQRGYAVGGEGLGVPQTWTER